MAARRDSANSTPAMRITSGGRFDFNDRYYASFVEDDNGIRIEFMYNPPRDAAAD